MGDWEPESFFSERALYLSIYLERERESRFCLPSMHTRSPAFCLHELTSSVFTFWHYG
jgi:hypothetical protein